MRRSTRILTFSLFSFGVLALGATAHAEEPFPAEISEAAGMPCVPSCLLCHTTNPGQAGTWVGKQFGAYMGTHGAKKGDAASIKTAYAAFAADPANMSKVMDLQKGLDPDNNTINLCTGPTYGCGAHIAKTTPQDSTTMPYWIAGALVLGSLLRRRKHERP